jgi:hypothetical protein
MSFEPLVLVTGDTVVLQYQVISEDTGFPVDITGNTFKFAAKLDPTQATYIIDPIDGSIDDAALGKFSFIVPVPATPDNGVYEVEMQDGGGAALTLTPGGGVAITIALEVIPTT